MVVLSYARVRLRVCSQGLGFAASLNISLIVTYFYVLVAGD